MRNDIRRAIGTVLTESLQEHDWSRPLEALAPAVRACDGNRLVAAAIAHGVEGCLHRSIHGLGALPADADATLELAYMSARQTQLRALHDLGGLARTLADAGVPWLVIKGPALDAVAYPTAGLRSYSDLDVVVARRDFERAVDAFARAGSPVFERNWELVRARQPGQLHVEVGLGTLVDLHWDFFNDPAARRAFTVDLDEVFANTRVIDIGGTDVCTPSPPETLLHLALHGCLSGGNQLGWVKDIDVVVRYDEPDWDVTVSLASAWGARIALGTMLLHARELLGAPVPDSVMRTLLPRAWRTALLASARLSPIEQSMGNRSSTRVLHKSVRANERRSFAELGRRTRAWIGSGSHHGLPHETDRDPESPSSLLFAAGSDADRCAYFASVGDPSVHT